MLIPYILNLAISLSERDTASVLGEDEVREIV